MNNTFITPEFLAKYAVFAGLQRELVVALSNYSPELQAYLAVSHVPRGPGGSYPGRSPNLPRNAPEGNIGLMRDYFNVTPVFSELMFRRRFRMSRRLFCRIAKTLGENDPYFTQRRDCTSKLGISPYQKCAAALRQLAYGTSADAQDEYLRIAESTAIETLKRFCMGVIQAFKSRYQRRPTPEDVERILEVNAHRGFPGMLGSLDCMHWEWKNCPKAWKGAYTGKEGTPSLVLEVVATQDLWIWHSFFGLPGSLNDINVLDRSNLFQDLSLGVAPPCQYTVNGNLYTTPYYLADGIYPEWATLVKTFSSPQDPKKKMFSKVQEATRKDVECAFGVLQARFAIIKGPSRMWQPAHLELIMNCCIILHNMIVEEEGSCVMVNLI